MLIGVTGLTLAALSIFSGLGGLVGPAFASMINVAPQGQPDPMAGAREHLWVNAVSGLNFVLLGGLLILASAWLMMHDRRCVPAFRAWAVLKFGAEAFSVYVGLLMAESQSQAALQQSGIPLPLTFLFRWLGFIAVGIGALIGIIFPVFVLAWFYRPSVRAVVAWWKPRVAAARSAAGTAGGARRGS